MLKEEGTQINIHLHFEMSDMVGGEPRPSILIRASCEKAHLASYSFLSPRPSPQAASMRQQSVSHPSALASE